MTGGNIVGLRPEQQQDMVEDDVTPATAEPTPEPELPSDTGARLLAAALVLVGLAWLGFVGWSMAMGRGTELPLLVGAVCAPLALLGVLGLLALRSSRRESLRFLATAQGMRAESARLEARVGELTARIDANREALSDQAIQLTQIGEEAAARLASITANIRHEGEAMDRHAETLVASAGKASGELDLVLKALPKAEQQTAALAGSLAAAGDAALTQAGALEAQVSLLVARSREADEVAGGAAQRLAVHLSKIEGTTEAARAQLDAAAEQMSAATHAALGRAAEALEEARRSVEAQGGAMLALVDQSRAAMETTGNDVMTSLAARLEEIGREIDAIGASIARHDTAGSALVQRLSTGLADVEERLDRVDQQGGARTERLASAVAALGEHADRLSASLAGASTAADGFVERSEALLTALDASAREIDETLPAALARLDGFAEASRERIAAMQPAIGQIEENATAALDRLAQTEKLLQQQRDAIELFGQATERQLQAGRRGAEELSEALQSAEGQMMAVADHSAPQLIDVMLRVRDAAAQAAERARETFERIVPQAAASIGHAADQAIESVVGARLEKQVLGVAEAAERAVAAANAAAAMLQDQLRQVEAGATAIEARVEAARAQADEGNRESFARRASLLMEALNSTAIDVAKILSNDVTDSAWSAYLKGDRGVFTRRAVRLLEAGESRAILTHYDEDLEFRGQVNRYIHDFEAMLRNVLATREGSQVAVTLLSSDMGKLYVALAQAIERLRT